MLASELLQEHSFDSLSQRENGSERHHCVFPKSHASILLRASGRCVLVSPSSARIRQTWSNIVQSYFADGHRALTEEQTSLEDWARVAQPHELKNAFKLCEKGFKEFSQALKVHY